uniref:Major facilitator superfamily MFS_1 n=1 Tax=Caulobacter sp. (strain K31) TaxID=366602 RepID=B0T7I0_CAUSK
MKAGATPNRLGGRPADSAAPMGGSYAWYATGVLALVYVLNFVDRQIISILAEDIKRDLHVTDAQLGFLYGTAFAIFYALFGIPFGMLADRWRRGRLIAIGLVVWSAMTAASGFAFNFLQLALARVGVGVGEATASPAAFSMLGDYFPRERRALAASLYSTGLYLGMGLSLPIGGWIAQSWNDTYAAGAAPFGLAGWQVAFLAVGLPGLAMALWVLTLREPVRGCNDGAPRPLVTPGAGKLFLADLAAILPPLTLWSVSRQPRMLAVNLAVAVLVAGVATLLCRFVGDPPQWIAYGVGVYAVFSWVQVIKVTDRPIYALIWGDPRMLVAIVAFGSLSVFVYSYGFWVAPYAIRTFGVTKAMAGIELGIPGAFASAIGVLIGGRLSDLWRARDPRGRIFVCMLAIALPLPALLWMFTTAQYETYRLISPVIYLVSSSWVGSAVASYQDLVLPRMRGLAGSTYLLGATMVGLALGPYVTGKVATVTGSLQAGVLTLFLVAPLSLLLLGLTARWAPGLEASKFDRARAAGEPDEPGRATPLPATPL